ncbi:hypothetical protein BESB_061740 [Besnoitia besnoiti]|uniref:Transmembrane protein n=1 Tax=Besnoitia besnoiti TaxID=94643 RepID=A0A2A9MI66_BESBE|nr:hypothetical protein BESB_061740 [Besnoitia besnoiti]PFH35287.1 hypothetical protein BESB_061740 [Besnoitia besnoiti]
MGCLRFISKYQLVDVYVVIFMVVFLHFALLRATPLPSAFSFLAYCLLSIFATESLYFVFTAFPRDTASRSASPVPTASLPPPPQSPSSLASRLPPRPLQAPWTARASGYRPPAPTVPVAAAARAGETFGDRRGPPAKAPERAEEACRVGAVPAGELGDDRKSEGETEGTPVSALQPTVSGAPSGCCSHRRYRPFSAPVSAAPVGVARRQQAATSLHAGGFWASDDATSVELGDASPACLACSRPTTRLSVGCGSARPSCRPSCEPAKLGVGECFFRSFFLLFFTLIAGVSARLAWDLPLLHVSVSVGEEKEIGLDSKVLSFAQLVEESWCLGVALPAMVVLVFFPLVCAFVHLLAAALAMFLLLLLRLLVGPNTDATLAGGAEGDLEMRAARGPASRRSRGTRRSPLLRLCCRSQSLPLFLKSCISSLLAVVHLLTDWAMADVFAIGLLTAYFTFNAVHVLAASIPSVSAPSPAAASLLSAPPAASCLLPAGLSALLNSLADAFAPRSGFWASMVFGAAACQLHQLLPSRARVEKLLAAAEPAARTPRGGGRHPEVEAQHAQMFSLRAGGDSAVVSHVNAGPRASYSSSAPSVCVALPPPAAPTEREEAEGAATTGRLLPFRGGGLCRRRRQGQRCEARGLASFGEKRSQLSRLSTPLLGVHTPAAAPEHLRFFSSLSASTSAVFPRDMSAHSSFVAAAASGEELLCFFPARRQGEGPQSLGAADVRSASECDGGACVAQQGGLQTAQLEASVSEESVSATSFRRERSDGARKAPRGRRDDGAKPSRRGGVENAALGESPSAFSQDKDRVSEEKKDSSGASADSPVERPLCDCALPHEAHERDYGSASLFQSLDEVVGTVPLLAPPFLRTPSDDTRRLALVRDPLSGSRKPQVDENRLSTEKRRKPTHWRYLTLQVLTRLTAVVALLAALFLWPIEKPRILDLEIINDKVGKYYPVISRGVKPLIPATVGNCTATGPDLPPEPCAGHDILYHFRNFYYEATARWITGVNTTEIEYIRLSNRQAEPTALCGAREDAEERPARLRQGGWVTGGEDETWLTVDIGGRISELNLSLRIGQCMTPDAWKAPTCDTLWDNTTSCCGKNITFSAQLEARCTDTPPTYFSAFNVTDFHVSPLKVNESVLGLFNVTVANITKGVEREIKAQIQSFLSPENRFIPWDEDTKLSLQELANHLVAVNAPAGFHCRAPPNAQNPLSGTGEIRLGCANVNRIREEL